MMKITFLVPTRDKPHPAFIAALEASIPLLEANGIEHRLVSEKGNHFISHARAELVRKMLDTDSDAAVFLDDDLSWRPQDLLALVQADADVAAGTYRAKVDEVRYWGTLQCADNGAPIVNLDGTLRADRVAAGFLKITRTAIRRFMRAYPSLVYGHPERPCIDLFQHGAYEGVWHGEDYRFCKRWRDIDGEIVLLPNLDLTHHADDRVYPGNFHEFLLSQPGGSKA